MRKKNSNINVFGYENKQPFPIYVSKEKYEDFMNLLLITEETKTHYVFIKDFNKFMYNQTKQKERKHFCMYCLQCFSSELVLNNHKEYSISINGKQSIKMLEKGSTVKLNNFHKQLPISFVIYADFEAIIEKYIDVRKIMINHTLKCIKNILIVAMVIKLFVVMMINTANLFRYIEVKKLYTNLWKNA